MQALEHALHDITRPMYVWRMASNMGGTTNPGLRRSADTRRKIGLEQIDAIVRRYVNQHPTTAEESDEQGPGQGVRDGDATA